MASHPSYQPQNPLDELLSEIRLFLTAERPDRTHFIRLVELLHALSPPERAVAYEHLMHETTHAKMSAADDERVRLLARLADFVGEEPPAPGSPRGAVLPGGQTPAT